MKTSGIYQILNTNNGHIYIGSATNIERRWKEHIGQLKKGKHHSIYLQRAWNIYGSDCFEFSIIETCTDLELIKREQYYMDTLTPQYNICSIAGSLIGTKRSDEVKQKMSQDRKGRIAWNKGKTLSDEHRSNIGKSLIGRQVWNKEKKNIYSDTTINKMKESKLGRKHSNEHNKKIGDSLRGRVRSDKHKANLSASQKGKPKSPEQIEKMRLSIKTWWQHRKENSHE